MATSLIWMTAFGTRRGVCSGSKRNSTPNCIDERCDLQALNATAFGTPRRQPRGGSTVVALGRHRIPSATCPNTTRLLPTTLLSRAAVRLAKVPLAICQKQNMLPAEPSRLLSAQKTSLISGHTTIRGTAMTRKLRQLVMISGWACLAAGVNAAEIDFEGLSEGQIIVSISNGAGATGLPAGAVTVRGFNPAFGVNVNAALVFDSSCDPGGLPTDCSGDDPDLGTPNEAFGGPGVGAGGGPGPFQNDIGRGNVAIIAEDFDDGNTDGLVDDPDDADQRGQYIEFDFTTLKGNGRVTVNSVTYLDAELEEGEDGARVELFGPGLPPTSFTLPPVGNNGAFTLSGIGVEGVTRMRIVLNGSGAIAGATLNEEPQRSCWVTTGGFFNAGITSGPKQCTFGGNVGPNPSGAFEVNWHDGPLDGFKFHTNDIEVVRCENRGSGGPGQPGGKKGLEEDTLVFQCNGRFNNQDGYTCTGYLLDAGEPQGKKGNNNDQIQLIVRDGGGTEVATCEGELDGGNVQIHPTNPGT